MMARGDWYTMKFVFALLILISLSCCSSSADHSALIGAPAPDVRVTLLSGDQVPLSKYRGKVTAVMFWATWCNASRSVIEEFNELAKESAGSEFVAISVDKHADGDKLDDRIRGKRLFTVEHAFSGNENYDEAYLKFQVEEIPQLFVLSETGDVLASGNEIDDIRCFIPGQRC
jgi:thiol-disulfide isomerase/thioredoxin